MKKLPQISEAEFEVMKLIWKHAPISTNEITERLLGTTDWNSRTIQTLIKRLTTKGAIKYEKQGRMFIYSPLVDQKDYLDHESKSFLDRFFNGRISAMVSSFLENETISQVELDDLRKLLNDKEGE